MKQSLALMLPGTQSLAAEGQPAVLPSLSFCSDSKNFPFQPFKTSAE